MKQSMKKGSFVPKNVPGVGWGGVGWDGLGVSWRGVYHGEVGCIMDGWGGVGCVMEGGMSLRGGVGCVTEWWGGVGWGGLYRATWL